jgi:hypothetical protein
MDRVGIEQALAEAEDALARGGKAELGKVGFWKAVNAVKQDPKLVQEYAGRIGQIDGLAFERAVLLKVPASVGTALMVVGTLIGLFLIGWAYQLTSAAQALALLVGTGMLLLTTHSLTHLVVGSAQGMKFTHWFMASLRHPTPGVKVDYSTYLGVPAAKRAWMHASGAITTKLIPFIAIGAGWAMNAPGWAMAILGLIAIGQIIIDIVWSTKTSDWMKFRREMSLSGS